MKQAESMISNQFISHKRESSQKTDNHSYDYNDFESIKSSSRFRYSKLVRRTLSALALFFSDVLTLTITFFGAALIRQEEWLNADILIFSTISIFFFLYACITGQYWNRIPFWDQSLKTLKLFFLLAIAHGALSTVLMGSSLTISFMITWILTSVFIILTRVVTKYILLALRLWQIPTVIIGNGQNAIETALALTDEKQLGYEIISFLSPSHEFQDQIEIKNKQIPVRHLDKRANKILRRLGKPYMIIALERGGMDKMQSYIDQLTLYYPSLSIAPALRGLPLFGAKPQHFFSHEVMMLQIQNNLSKLSSRIIKRTFDIVVASVLIVCFTPLFLILMYLVRKTGKQVFFGHKRVGLNGKQFKCYKFRSMVENSKEVLEHLLATDDLARREWFKDFKLKNDPRITKIGRILRKSSLDELPQLWNVIKGDMSLVGPRPVITDEIPYYGKHVDFYYKSRPGMTGLWQVSGRNDVDYESRVQLDVWYISNWSLWNDIVIMIRTISVVLNRSGAY